MARVSFVLNNKPVIRWKQLWPSMITPPDSGNSGARVLCPCFQMAKKDDSCPEMVFCTMKTWKKRKRL
jgi:hypothetical protein